MNLRVPLLRMLFFILTIVSYGIFVVMIVPISLMSFVTSDDADLIRSATISILGLFATLNVFLAILIRFKIAGTPLIRFRTSKKVTSDPLPTDAESIAIVSNIATIVSYFLVFTLIVYVC